MKKKTKMNNRKLYLEIKRKKFNMVNQDKN